MDEADALVRQQRMLERVLELTDTMLEQAERGQWESVAELLPERDALIRAFFAEPNSLEADRLAEGIRHVINSDQRLSSLIGEERGALQAEIQKLKQGKNAVKAYSSG